MSVTSTSLLDRLLLPDDRAAWQRLVDLYTPLIRGWLRRHNLAHDDADDVVQEVLTVVVRRLPDFQHNRRPGAFRTWLRVITANCLRDFWRGRRLRPGDHAGADLGALLDQLEDPNSHLSKLWDKEHDEQVMRRLLELLEPQFAPTTWQAFRRVALDGVPAEVVAAELGITVNAVFIAKSRVLSKLRQEGAGLIDGA